MTEINEALARKVLETVDAGLSKFRGIPQPGFMCVEAAVTYAMGENFSDYPSCVERNLRDFKIGLNDRDGWIDKAGRAAGLRRISIAQLGSAGVLDWSQFCKDLGGNLGCPISPSTDSVVSWIANKKYNVNGFALTQNQLKEIAEAAVQALIKQDIPGTRFLYLTESK